MRSLHHVTLTTGHRRESARAEVDDAVIAPLQAIIEHIASGTVAETVPIPAMPGYSIGGRASGRCLVATVWADGPPSELLLSLGVAGHSRCGAEVWRTLHGVGLPPGILMPPADARIAGKYRLTSADHQPPTPWCAVTLTAEIGHHPDAMLALGDLERCLAWAFLELRHG